MLSFLQRKPAAGPPAADPQTDGVRQARTRARQRLIGALLLLTIGVIGFPLLFESQPRPIPVDIPIDIPSKDAVPPLAVPGGNRAASSAAAAPRPAEPPGEPVITEAPADAGRDITAAPPPVAATAPRPAAPAPSPGADAARAQALLDGKAAVTASAPASQSSEARYIVQVGAFADPAAARETRMKVERLGLKTYTQLAETPGGQRIRVRVGPFAARADADKAMARVKAAGVAAAVLTL